MAKDPAFLFYPNDFISGTQFFSDEQVGKYIRILMAQHQHGRLTEKQVIFISKSYDNDVFSKLVKDDNGLFYNKRLEDEIVKRKNYAESRSKNKLGKTKLEIISKSYETHMVNRNINVNSILENKKENKKNENDMIVREMIKVWKKFNPVYLEDIENDFTACLQIAYKIAEIKGWNKQEVLDLKELDVLASWTKIMQFVSSNNFLKDFPLKNLNNNFQMVVQKMQNSISKKEETYPKQEKKYYTEEEKQKAMEEWANSE